MKSNKMLQSSLIDVSLRTNEGMKFQATHVQRLNESLDKNSICESSPNRMHEGTTFEKIMNLRPRERSKELDGDMTYKPKSNIEKVINNF